MYTVNGYTPIKGEASAVITSTIPFFELVKMLDDLLRNHFDEYCLQTIDPKMSFIVNMDWDDDGENVYYIATTVFHCETYTSIEAFAGRLLGLTREVEDKFFNDRRERGYQMLHHMKRRTIHQMGELTNDQHAQTRLNQELNKLFVRQPFAAAVYQTKTASVRIEENPTNDMLDNTSPRYNQPEYTVLYHSVAGIETHKAQSIAEAAELAASLL